MTVCTYEGVEQQRQCRPSCVLAVPIARGLEFSFAGMVSQFTTCPPQGEPGRYEFQAQEHAFSLSCAYKQMLE